ncbi:MAG: glutamine amidotransferase [Acidimicrobiia bacterium]|nr:glutamine amidotransferase [Acidimicrobiia bacterium]
MNVLVLAHGPEITPGWLTEALAEVEADPTIVDLGAGDAIPDGAWDRIVVLGGHMGAYDTAEHPWLDIEKAFLSDQLAADTPLLGVCLGSQLLAEVAGGAAYRAPTTEAGLLTVQPTVTGAADPTLSAIDGPVVVWHHDTFDLPPEAELLAATADYPHAFRVGSALGVQFHPEVTPAMWQDWVAAAGTDELVASGIDPDDMARRISEEAPRLRRQAVRFFSTWLEE